MDQNLSSISTEVLSEINSQRAKWGKQTDDSKNTPWMWAAYIAQYSTRWMAGTFAPIRREQTNDFRASMVQTAALAISAIDSIDRQRAEHEATFYECVEG